MQEVPTKTKGPTQEEYDSLLAGKLAAGYAGCCYGYKMTMGNPSPLGRLCPSTTQISRHALPGVLLNQMKF